MRSPLPAMTVIVCPHCGTRYQVPVETLGPGGREVQCAHCGKSWAAVPGAGGNIAGDPDQLFDETAERDLDAAFAEEEKAVAAAAVPEGGAAEDPMRSIEEIKAALAPKTKPVEPKADPRARTRRDKAFARRRISLTAKLPLARIRRAARLVALGLLLTLIVAGIAFRTEIVRGLPALAGAYAALGMKVNIVGLEFRDTHTLMTLRSGANVLKVDARIYSVASRPVIVPPVVVTLLDENGAALYEWSVTPETRDLEPGEVVDFTTQLSSPPVGATRVRLTFSGGRAQSETPVAAAIQPKETAH
ncbi:MAG: zinc-ribbon domain-containing protein [Devosia sp.]|nr:zinc-ribbon domain-containing protein [Devosia sp.]